MYPHWTCDWYELTLNWLINMLKFDSRGGCTCYERSVRFDTNWGWSFNSKNIFYKVHILGHKYISASDMKFISSPQLIKSLCHDLLCLSLTAGLVITSIITDSNCATRWHFFPNCKNPIYIHYNATPFNIGYCNKIFKCSNTYSSTELPGVLYCYFNWQLKWITRKTVVTFTTILLYH